VAEILVGRQIWHVEAIAGGVELPAVIDAAQSALLVASEKQRGAAMRTTVIENADPPRAVAKGDQFLTEQHQPQRIAIRRQLQRKTGGQPVLPHQITHWRAGPDAGQQFVFSARGHVSFLRS
jgi:hypothetical protein